MDQAHSVTQDRSPLSRTDELKTQRSSGSEEVQEQPPANENDQQNGAGVEQNHTGGADGSSLEKSEQSRALSAPPLVSEPTTGLQLHVTVNRSHSQPSITVHARGGES